VAQYALSTDFTKYGLPAAALDGYTGDINDLLIEGSAKVDTYLRGRYKVPLASPYPKEVIKAVCVLAAWDLLTIRGFDMNSEADSAVRSRYDDLCGRPMQPGWLERISQGRINLDIAADTTPSKGEGAPIVTSSASVQCSKHNNSWHSSEDCFRFW
jgi:phage gp36-like protein